MERLDEKLRTQCPLLAKRVKLVGTNREDLNGKAGDVIFFDHAQNRYVVALDHEKEEGKMRALKPKHLKEISLEPAGRHNTQK